MPVDLSCIYRNPIIPHGYYYTKITAVHTQPKPRSRPLIEVTLRIGPIHKKYSGTSLSSLIHPTESAIYYFVNWANTFRVQGDQYDQAIGRWGCIEVRPTSRGKTKYSEVKYVYQPRDVFMIAMKLERMDGEGTLDQYCQRESRKAQERISA